MGRGDFSAIAEPSALLLTCCSSCSCSPFADFAAPHISQTHKKIGVFLGSVMWFWVFYRAREDGPALLGFVKPWDAHGDHGDHGHGHGDEHHEGEHHSEEKQLH